MLTPAASLGAVSPLLWLVGLFALGFGLAWLLTDLGGMPRSVYVFILAVATGAFTAAYLIWSGTDPVAFLLHQWWWGLAGAAVVGFALSRLIARQPAELPRRGARLTIALVWEGVVYGATEGLLLSVLPVLLVWQSAWLAGWRGSGAVAAGALGLVASFAFIGIHHLGYRGFRSRHVLIIMAACSLLSIGYLITGSPLSAIVGHVFMHFGAVLHGAEMPPYAKGHAFTVGPTHGAGFRTRSHQAI